MEEKVCMITGANTGIGKATAKALAKMNVTVIMVCRDRERGKLAQKEIIEETGNH